MCGRYFLTTPGELLADLFETAAPDAEIVDAIQPRYNIAPTQLVPIVRQGAGGERELALARWGLIPHWAKDPAIGNKLINARSETAAEKPSFRDSFRKRRCLIPADGYFEWKQEGPAKQPYLFRRQDRVTMAFAGLWSAWKNPATGEPVESCAILTTSPNTLAATVHDRMPVLLEVEGRRIWLDSEAAVDTLANLFLPTDPAAMETFPVSRRVNSPANDSAEILLPLAV